MSVSSNLIGGSLAMLSVVESDDKQEDKPVGYGSSDSYSLALANEQKPS